MKRIFFLIICLPIFLNAQDNIKGSYDTLYLKAGMRYTVKETVTVNTKFIVEAGARVDFSANGKLVVEGTIMALGLENSPIVFIGSKANDASTGLVIRSSKESDVHFRYVVFDSLSMPISFESGWYRKNVVIENCQFRNTIGSVAVIQMLNPKSGSDKPVISFSLLSNLFYKNTGSLYFEDFQSDYLKLFIQKNVFLDNLIAGFGQYTFSGNFLYGRNDYKSGKHIADIRDNSFVRNFLKDIDADTIIKVAHFGIYGSAPALNVPSNYWGSPVEADVHGFVYDYVTNFNNPRLTLTGLLRKPTDTSFGHVYQVNVNGKLIADDNLNNLKGIKYLTLFANRRYGTGAVNVKYHYLKDSTVQADTVFSVKRRIESTGAMELSISDSAFIATKPGYFVISNLVDELGAVIPDVTIGQRSFLSELYRRRKKLEQLLAVAEEDKPDTENIEIKGNRLSVGLIGGTSIFFGTVSDRAIFANDKNALFGVAIQYRLNRTVTIAGAFQQTTLSGSDNNSSDAAKQARGMSFVTPLTFMSLKTMFGFGQDSRFFKRLSLMPSFGVGLSYISFNPQGEYLGKLYNLQPLGTGGQLLAGSTEGPYQTSTLGTIVSFELTHRFAKKWAFSIFIDYNASFTDYLDDVGPNAYPDRQLMESQLGPIAAYFSNPTNKAVGLNELRSGVSNSKDAFFTFGFKLCRSLKLGRGTR